MQLTPGIRRLILIIAFAVLFWVITWPVGRIKPVDVEKLNPQRSSEEVTFEEMTSFLETWSQYLQSDAAKNAVSLSLSTKTADESISPGIKRWLAGRGWTPGRFFYVEQRLKSVVDAALLKRHLEANRQMLASLGGKSSGSYGNLAGIIADQERRLEGIQATPEEIAMVMPNLDTIDEILKGQAVYKP